MAATAIKLAMARAQYTTGRTQSEPRCSSCAARDATQGRKQHGTWCMRFGTAVKTHGVCAKWEPA